MVVLSLCFSMLSIRAWDRLTVNRSKDKYKDAIYTCMGQTNDGRNRTYIDSLALPSL